MDTPCQEEIDFEPLNALERHLKRRQNSEEIYRLEEHPEWENSEAGVKAWKKRKRTSSLRADERRRLYAVDAEYRAWVAHKVRMLQKWSPGVPI